MLPKLMTMIFALGLVFTACERDEMNEPKEPQSSNLQEAPFTNYMVISENSNVTKSVNSKLKMSGGEILRTIPEIGITVVSSNDVDFAIKARKNKNVISVIPDYEIKWIPSDVGQEVAPPSVGDAEPFYGYLWGMDAINAPEAWNSGFTGQGASVFVLDSGIDAEHRDIAPNLNTNLSKSFIAGEDWNIRPGVYFNHGTHVAGTIAAAQNEFGVIGVAYEAELVAVKVLSEFTGSGPFSSINAGIVYAANHGADVINMSLGATLNKNGTVTDADGNQYKIPAKFIQELILAQQRAVDYAYKKGTTVIASAGNDGTNYDGNKSLTKLPGELNNIITVSATAPEGWNFDPTSNYDIPASYTTYGRSLIDIAAPGGDFDVSQIDMIVSAGSGNSFFFSAGTSMAAPHVSGVAALLIAQNGGEMDPHSVAKKIYKSADKIDGNGKSPYFGKGRINAYRALTE